MFRITITAFIVFFLLPCCKTEKKHAVPSFVSNKKPDTHFFEQVILKKNSTEVLFYFKFNYKRNKVSIYRPDSEHTDVWIELNKRFSADSAYLNIELNYFEYEDKRYPEVKQKKGKPGLYEPFFYSDDSEKSKGRSATSERTFVFVRNGDDYQFVDGFLDSEEGVQRLRHFIFDENTEEQYFFSLKTAEEVVSYPNEKKK